MVVKIFSVRLFCAPSSAASGGNCPLCPPQLRHWAAQETTSSTPSHIVQRCIESPGARKCERGIILLAQLSHDCVILRAVCIGGAVQQMCHALLLLLIGYLSQRKRLITYDRVNYSRNLNDITCTRFKVIETLFR